MIMPSALQRGLEANLNPFECFPIEIEPDLAAEPFELVELFSPDELLGGKMDGFRLGLGGGGFHQLLDQVLVQVQRGTHMPHGMHSPCICQIRSYWPAEFFET